MIRTDESILHRMLGPEERAFPPEVARFFLDLSFTDLDRERIATLSEKANEGIFWSPSAMNLRCTFCWAIFWRSRTVRHASP